MAWELQPVLAHVCDMEGFRTRVYRDTRGFDSIGFGWNLDDASALETAKVHGLNLAALKSGAARLEYADALAIASDRILDGRYEAKQIIPGLDDLPQAVQVVVGDLEYNMGHPVFKTFHDTIASINAGDYVAAAFHLVASKWYGEVGRRGEADVELLKGAA